MAAAKGKKPEDEHQEKLPTEPPVKPGDELLPPVAEGADEPDPSKLSKETLLPVTGMVRLSPRELEVIDHPAFQRLFEIYQLGQTHLVYRGATHMRGEHAIGCVEAATAMIRAIERNSTRVPDAPADYWRQAPPLSAEEEAFARLGALLHDIGHLPAGHTLEDELGLLPKHDGDARIEFLLDRPVWRGEEVDSLRSLIDKRYSEEAATAAQASAGGKQLTASELLVLLVSSDHKKAKSTPETEFRVGVLRDIIGNTICADLIDYLQRDWLHIGKPRDFDPRLLEYMMILSRLKNGEVESRLVIDIGSKGRPRPDAVTAIMDLLESRYQLSEIALFHRVKLAATGMLERAIAEYRDTFPARSQQKAMGDLVPELVECSDTEFIALLEQKLESRRSKGDPERIQGAIDLCRRLRVRRLHSDFYSVYRADLAPATVTQIGERYSGDPTASEEQAGLAVRTAAKNRLEAVRGLERELKLPPCSIVMYCPPLEMNSKIAGVGIYNRGLVDSLVNLDSSGEITGGYLAALQARFQRLWRISFAIDPLAGERFEKAALVETCQRLIDRTTLWVREQPEETADGPVRAIAETLVAREGSPWFEHEVVDRALNREQEDFHHPGGAPSARSFITPDPKGS